MPTRLHIEGKWPGTVSIRRGWARAAARPWNDDLPHSSLRLVRGGRDFLSDTANTLVELAGGNVFSPALYTTATDIWKKAGFEINSTLDVMERRLDQAKPEDATPVELLPAAEIGELVPIETSAFDPFWRMSVHGLREACQATPRSVILVTRDDHHAITGYSIAGAQSGVSFLQRIGVSDRHSGAGLGTALVQASFIWARKQGARTMILNVRPGNPGAHRLYEKNGFVMTKTTLELLEFEG